ncbi:Family S53 protease [Mycena venus]|uniref:Family S53 protease n=1 Tax=Mycena venus TaxID=2733690 RepID=A0A8H6XJC6_9AGAR|nr:Family S53 protease [Mycena venus]
MATEHPVILASYKGETNSPFQLIPFKESFSVGETPEDKILSLRLALTHNDISDLHDIYEVSTPGNPRYRQYLSKGEVEKFVAPSADTLAQVKFWLPSDNLTALPLTGVSQANELLGVDFSTTLKASTKAIYSTVTRVHNLDIDSNTSFDLD